jgi:hypothetical protein
MHGLALNIIAAATAKGAHRFVNMNLNVHSSSYKKMNLARLQCDELSASFASHPRSRTGQNQDPLIFGEIVRDRASCGR